MQYLDFTSKFQAEMVWKYEPATGLLKKIKVPFSVIGRHRLNSLLKQQL